MRLPASPPLLTPDDEDNRALVEQVHPPDWKNPEPADRYNLVVVGAGSAGLVSAVGAAAVGAKVAIVERHLMGGDCLNFGCVPSKSLVRSARVLADVRAAADFGVRVGAADLDFAAAMGRLRRLRSHLAATDSVTRLTELGIDVFFGHARFIARDAIEVDGRRLRFARAVIATGARAVVPPVPGLADAGYLTSATVFSLTALPRRIVVVGAGSIGCELAQVFRRFGSHVTLVDRESRVMPSEDPDASAVLHSRFVREGIRLLLDTQIARVGREDGSAERSVALLRGGREEVVRADVLLVASGRTPNVEDLDLERAGIRCDRRGVIVDDRLRTTNRRVWAAGDVASTFKFTHAADALARVALQNALFFGRKSASALVIPRATYTDPEIAHVGISAEEAARRRDVRTLTVQFTGVDRAVIDGVQEGFARIHAGARGRILGATVVASHAGEMIGEMSLAISAGLSMRTLAQTIHAYPTQGECWKKLGDEWNRTRLTPRVRSLFDAFLRWRR
jgi:pyruvate/2-oxoglutarate dehydrogenase complex dihydrolipoamide dehydrogenase (E3) component